MREIRPKLFMPPRMYSSSRCSGSWPSEASRSRRMDSRVTANGGPLIASPADRLSNVVAIAPLLSHRPNRPAAAGTDYVALPVEEDVVANDEQPFAPGELVERAGLEPQACISAMPVRPFSRPWAGLRNLLYSIINFPECQNQAVRARNPCPS